MSGQPAGCDVKNSSSRVRKLAEAMLVAPEICVERGCLITDSYRETEGQPSVIRRARALEKILREMTISIDKGELIVGKTTSKRRGCLLMPEVQWEWYLGEMDTFSTREWDRCAPLTKKDKAKMLAALPYWKGRCTWDKWVASVPDSVQKLSGKVFLTNTSSLSGVHFGHFAVDYERVLAKGLNGIKQEVEQEIGKLNLAEIKDFEKYQFLQAVIIDFEAVMGLAARYAALARSLAENQTDASRKKELERIAVTCEWVPANPARSFYEAIQSIQFIYIALRIEAFGPGISYGRPDQYLSPYYRKDIDEGKLTVGEARELLGLLLIKINDLAALMAKSTVETLAGFPTLGNITLGGVTKDGKDAVNELSYLFLEAETEVKLTAEEIVIRVSRSNPDAFLIKACEVANALRGKLKFVSDDTTILQLLSDGKPLEYARDFIVVGCFAPTVPVHSFDITGGAINLPLLLELALNNGVSRITGEQIGPRTGDPKQFQAYDEVWEAYRRQVEALIPSAIISRNIDRQIYAELAPCPFQSSLMTGCIARGVDITNGGTVPFATESQGFIGAPNVGDSLAAIKKAVFEDRTITMSRLIEALDNNFKSEQKILQIIRNCPKFGNDEDYVDTIVNDVLVHASRVVMQHMGISGTKHIASAAAGTGHLTHGKNVGATPDGRRAGEPLSEGGISPYQGRNTKGLTATLKSVAKLDHTKLSGGSVLNMRINPDILKDDTKIKKFVSLIRTYCETGGYHVQFNIIGSDTLRNAQKSPEKYRDLLVRVATYSAYFVELSPRVQNDIIARTEFQEL